MLLLFSPTGYLEIAFFLLAVIVFMLAVRFFVSSRRHLEEVFPGLLGSSKLLPFRFDRSGFLIPKPVSQPERKASQPRYQASVTNDGTKEEIKSLRVQLQQQQQELSKALEQISQVSHRSSAMEEGSHQLLDEQKRIESLRMQLNKKDAELQRLRQQELLSQKLQERFEEVNAEFELLQEKMQKMEKQAWQAAELSIQLEHAEQSQFQLEKTLQKKEEKIRDLSQENLHLQESLQELEEKLSYSNLQRQQLIRKVQFLEESNADMLTMAETNRKLKTEISRVAELESMLELMSEEKKAWINKR